MSAGTNARRTGSVHLGMIVDRDRCVFSDLRPLSGGLARANAYAILAGCGHIGIARDRNITNLTFVAAANAGSIIADTGCCYLGISANGNAVDRAVRDRW